ncbi:hypothetical protein [Branchiibius sp. NY16-3462-2]|uniref:hypothetical protein n=1 Tax=Branchiibius sp. NY16-3462-2 TaxID=1807500 RepID=UPI000794EAB3|nr:hypothetical protein [Branchiibius sp. NY16-3462-2]KYH43670.1 hypothetical protein AZH51_02345 [Branchiibius sp. NY16-3462-2]
MSTTKPAPCPPWCTWDHTQDPEPTHPDDDVYHRQIIHDDPFWTIEVGACQRSDGTFAPVIGANIGDDFAPDEARALARDLLRAADVLDEILRNEVAAAEQQLDGGQLATNLGEGAASDSIRPRGRRKKSATR